MPTIHSSPIHFIPPATVGATSQVLTAIDNFGNTAWQNFPNENFDFSNIQFVAANGSDTNSGTSFNSPKLTLTAALADVSVNGVVWILDSGSYSENLVINISGLTLFAPNAKLDGDITVNATSTVIWLQYLTNSTLTINNTYSLYANIINYSSVTIINNGSLYGNIGRLYYGDTEFIDNLTVDQTFTASGLQYPTTDGSSGEVIGTNGSGILSFQSSGFFNYVNTIFVAQNGSDSNSGTAMSTPVQTLQHAIDLVAALPGASGLINILDSGTYNEELVFPGTGFMYIYGPAAAIQTNSAGDTITLTDTASRYVITFNVFQINNFGAGNIFNVAGALSSVFCYAQLYQSGNIYNEGGFVIKGVALVGTTITNTATGQMLFDIGQGISVTIVNSGTIGGEIGGVPSQVYGSVNYNDAQTINNNYIVDSINTQIFTSSGTYTPSSNLSFAIVEVIGSGGGGGGAASAAAQSAAAGGGGGGAYAKSTLSATSIGVSQTVTIGAGGSGGAAGNNNGSNGATSSFGALVTADGGSGGFGSAASATTPSFGIYGAGGGAGVGQIVKNGDSGLLGVSWGVSQVGIGGQGGNSFYGIGGEQLINLAGANGFNYGSGGGGGSSGNTGAVAGGNGADGVVIVTEYLQV